MLLCYAIHSGWVCAALRPSCGNGGNYGGEAEHWIDGKKMETIRASLISMA